jgi:hypothetical protein
MVFWPSTQPIELLTLVLFPYMDISVTRDVFNETA